jgi:hypothetical protein
MTKKEFYNKFKFMHYIKKQIQEKVRKTSFYRLDICIVGWPSIPTLIPTIFLNKQTRKLKRIKFNHHSKK